jgi:hypothetical protein
MTKSLSPVFAFVLLLPIAVSNALDRTGSQQPSIRLVKEIGLTPFGGVPFLADLNGDGVTEFLWLQSAGEFYSKVNDLPPYANEKLSFSAGERNHYCLTATDDSGKVIWQIGKPWKGERPFVTNSTERSLDVGDIDGDGRVEVVAAMLGKLVVVDGKSGSIKKSIALESDNMQIVRIARRGRGPTDRMIMVGNSDFAYPPHDYANPVCFYDSDLRLLRKADYLGAGHDPRVEDFDGDGLDEFLIGFNRIDHQLRLRWAFEPVPKEKWNGREMHVDAMTVGRVGNARCIAYAASNTTYIVTLEGGKLLWQKEGVHPQHTEIGHFVPGSQDNQVLVVNKRANVELLDGKGQRLWSIDPPPNFPRGGAYQGWFHGFDPSTKLPGLGPEGTDVIIYSDHGWPYIINGFGERYLDFPFTGNITQDWGRVPRRADDYGYGYYVRMDPASNAGRFRVVISDRRWAWFYEIRKADGGN